jgi:ABC-type sugar transport system substrate-binding protein
MARRLGLFVCAVIVSMVGCRPGGNTAERGVVLLRYNPGSESTEQREKGFLDTLAKEFQAVHV